MSLPIVKKLRLLASGHLRDPAAPIVSESADTITELYEALATTHRLISDFAASGFTDPDIGQRLFENQGSVNRALDKARGEPA